MVTGAAVKAKVVRSKPRATFFLSGDFNLMEPSSCMRRIFFNDRCGSGVAKGHEGHAAEMRRCMQSEGQLSVLLGEIERPKSCGKRQPHALPGEIEGK